MSTPKPEPWERTYDTLALARELAPQELFAMHAQMHGPLAFTEREGLGVASALVTLPPAPAADSAPEPAPEPVAARPSKRRKPIPTDQTAPALESTGADPAPPVTGEDAPRDTAP